MSEIVRATKINVASCHAVLSTLVACGYLSRDPKTRTYSLGRVLVALGQAALRADPLVAYAEAGAARLQRDLGYAVILTTAAGDEILAILSLADNTGNQPRLRAGERMPLVAPVGAPFVAWSSESVIESWITRHSPPRDKRIVAAWRHTLELTRKRGYQVMLRAPNSQEIGLLMAEMASGSHVSNHKDEVLRLINSFGNELSQPESIEADELYDILIISAPLFDRNGETTYNLSLTGFSAPQPGNVIINLADQLVRTCLEVMRADRANRRPAGRDGQRVRVGAANP